MRATTRLLAILAMLVAAMPAAAEPPVGTNPNAGTIVNTCGGATLTITTILHNSAAAAQVTGASTGVVILQGLEGRDASGALVFEFRNRGFERNGLTLTTCTFTNPKFPGITFTGHLLITPAHG